MTAPILSDLLKPGQPLPSDDAMISKALEIIEQSPHGQQLVDFARINNISIKIMAAPQPVTYLPESKTAYVGFNRKNPVSPSAFVLLLAGVLREAQQEAAGIKHPPLQAPLQEHMNVSLSKQEDKVWYICTVATELNAQKAFTGYNFLDELRKIGHDEALDLYLKQAQKSGG